MQTHRLPTFFAGHGNPMHSIQENVFTQSWKLVSASIPQPQAILVISAHWLTEGTFIHVGEHPKTIHDFYGFPQELYTVAYPALGSPTLATRIQKEITHIQIQSDTKWGLDHGTWSVLRHMYPDAEIPVVQLSIDITKPLSFHYKLGQALSFLRDEGVLILGSGNIVHNLGMVQFHETAVPHSWAIDFDNYVHESIVKHDHQALIDLEASNDTSMAIPTPDHYIPLLYVLGASHATDSISFPTTGFDLASISMRSVLIL